MYTHRHTHIHRHTQRNNAVRCRGLVLQGVDCVYCEWTGLFTQREGEVMSGESGSAGARVMEAEQESSGRV